MPIIAPSLLSANFLNLDADCKMLNESQADWYHLDVMDGRFVPNISFGPMLVSFFRKATTKVCDVHLMIEEPGKYAEQFKNAGADVLSVHIEACPHLHRNIQQIKSLGMKAGVAINPHTPVEDLLDILADIDLVCMMSVNPGFGGQKFIHHTLQKIKTLRKMIDEKGLKVLIEIDGGVTLENAGTIVAAGAEELEVIAGMQCAIRKREAQCAAVIDGSRAANLIARAGTNQIHGGRSLKRHHIRHCVHAHCTNSRRYGSTGPDGEAAKVGAIAIQSLRSSQRECAIGASANIEYGTGSQRNARCAGKRRGASQGHGAGVDEGRSGIGAGIIDDKSATRDLG